jgi:DNA-binding PadR family transcriptional regulator
MTDTDLFSGMIRLHVLHHADEGPIFGLAIIEELRHHGYQISAGTMYPMLHGLERKGYLMSRYERREGRERRIYRITPPGRRALEIGRTKVRELFGELIEGHRHRKSGDRRSARWAQHAASMGHAHVDLRSLSALVMTDAELRLIASAAIIGDSSQPVRGYSTPAASGIPSAL